MITGGMTAGQSIDGAQHVENRSAAGGQDGGDNKDGEPLPGWLSEDTAERVEQIAEPTKKTLRHRW